jgi:hypothetical protein
MSSDTPAKASAASILPKPLKVESEVTLYLLISFETK